MAVKPPKRPREPFLPPHRINWGDEKPHQKRKISPLFVLLSLAGLAAGGAGVYVAVQILSEENGMPHKNAADTCLGERIVETVSEMNPPINTTVDILKEKFSNLVIECDMRTRGLQPAWYIATYPDIFNPDLPNRSLHIRVRPADDFSGRTEYKILGAFLPLDNPNVKVEMIPLENVIPGLKQP